MFEKYLERLIKQKLGAFIEGLDQNQFSFGVTNANLLLENVKLKSDALTNLNLPIQIQLGLIKRLEIRIPWLKIGSQPIEVLLDGLNLIVTPQKKNLWQVIDIFDQEALEQKVFKIANDQLFELQKTENKGYFEKLAMKVLDNIQIKIKGVHFRLEDHFSGDTSYTFGIVMKSLDIHTTNQIWEPSFIDRATNNANLYKILKIDEFGFYLNPNDSFLIHQQTENQVHQVQMMDSVLGMQEQLTKNANSLNSNINYVLNPMNLRVNMEYKTHPNKKLDVSINLEKYQLSLQKSQLKCFISFFELASEYHSFQNDLYITFELYEQYYRSKCKKFKFLRPLSEKIVPNKAQLWWRYAYECIKRSNKSRKGSMREFNIPRAQLKLYRDEFTKLFKALWKSRENKRKFGQEDFVMWRQILISLDDKTLTAWILEALKSLDKKSASKEAKKQIPQKGSQSTNNQVETKKKGFTSWLFNRTSSSDNAESLNEQKLQTDLLQQDEINELENELEQSAFFADISSNETSFFMVMVINESAVEIGEVNSQNVYEGIILFSRNIQISFKKFDSSEGQFEIETSIQDYGVDLFSFNRSSQLMMERESVIMSNKRLFPMSQEEQFKVRIRKQPQDLKNVDFDIEMVSKEFLKRVISISKIKVGQETQNAAIDKMGDWREATSNQIYQIIYKKSNRFSINIASPVLILPLSADSNPKSPVWVVRLGDISLVSDEQIDNSSSVIEYEYYSMHIESMRLQFYTSFDQWKSKISSLSNLREKTVTQQQTNSEVFSVIEDCWMKLNLGIKQKKAGQIMLGQEQYKEHQKKPKVLLSGQTSPISINLSPTIFNTLVNLSRIFDLESDQNGGPNQVDQEQIQSKREVAQNAIKIGSLKKRLDPVKQWENFFCMLSGGYLYFYKDSTQLMPSTYFYLKGAQVEENKAELGLDHNLFIWGRFGECCLSFAEDIIMKDWALKLRTRIYDLSAENVVQFEEEQKAQLRKARRNYDNVQMEVNFKVPSFNIMLLKEQLLSKEFTNQSQCIQWVQLQFSRMVVKQITRKADSSMKFEMSEMKLDDLTIPVNSNLVSQSHRTQKGTYDYNSNLALDMNILSVKKESPRYQNVDTQIDLKMSNIDMKFQPFTINSILKFFNNTKFKGFPGLDYSRERSSSQIYKSLVEDDSLDKSSKNNAFKQPQEANGEKCTCAQVKETLIKFTCEIYSISAGMLHQKYNMEIFRLDADYLKITYTQNYDHMNFETSLKDISLYDLTGYPYTHDPKTFFSGPKSLKQNRNLIMAVDSRDQNNGLLFQFESYDHPSCPKKKIGYKSKIFLSIRPLKLNYVQEVVLRFYSYFFDQFLEAIMTTDPYKDPRNEIEMQKKRQTLKSDHIKSTNDFQQVKEIMDMQIIIGDVNILLQDRFHSKEYVSLIVQEINISEELATRNKRIPSKPSHHLFVNIFKLDLKNIMLKYGLTNNEVNAPLTHGLIGGRSETKRGKQLCKSPFNLTMNFEKLAFSPLFEKIDMHDLEQYIQIDLDFQPIELLLPQDIYTYILRCLDLNINYQDAFQEDFFFINYTNLNEYTKLLKDVIGMKINLNFLSLSLLMQHMDGSFLSELLLNNMQFNMIKYMDYDKKMNLSCEQFYILEQESRLKDKQVQSMSPNNKPKESSNKKKKANKVFKLEELLTLQQYKEELFKEIVISPLNSLQFLSEKQLQPNKVQKSPLLKAPSNQLVVQMDTLPNGDKFIRVNIQGLKIIVKPHIFLMVYYFFLNSFPVYDLNSIDKPNFFNTDPEDSAKMDFELSIEDSLICLQNKPGYKTIACEGRIFFKFKSDRVKDKKAKFQEESGFDIAIRDDDGSNSGGSQIEVSGETKIIWLMEVRVNDLCPFVCSMGQLNGIKDFQKIKKRQLLTPFEIYYSSRLDLCIFTPQSQGENMFGIVAPPQDMFGVDSFTEIFIERVKMKLSIQDMHLIFQILSYASENVTSEYFKKLEKIEVYTKEMKNEKQSYSPVSDQERMCESPKLMNTGKRSFMNGRSYTKTSMSKEGLMKVRSASNEGVDQDEMEQNFDELFEDLKKTQGDGEKHSMASQFSRLRNTTMAFSKIADKYTSAYNRGSNLKKIVVKNFFKDQVYEMQVQEEEDEKLEESLASSKQSLLQGEGEIDDIEYEEGKTSENLKEVKHFFNGENKASNKRTFTVDNIYIEEVKSLTNGEQKRKLSNTSHQNKQNLTVAGKDSAQNSQMQKKKDMGIETGGISAENYEDARSDMFYSFKSKMHSQIDSNQQNKNDAFDNMSKGSKRNKKEHQASLDEQKKSNEPILSVFDHVQKTKMSFESGGLQVLFINDFDQVFCPVLDLDIPDIQFRQTNESSENQMIEFEIQKCKIFYFNAKIGDWEPFIENFQVKCLFNSVKNQKFVKVEFNKPIIVNITESCLQNLIESYNSWMATPPFQMDEGNFNEVKSSQLSINDDEQESEHQEESQERSKSIANDIYNEINDIDQVTPYTIKNLTHLKLNIINSGLNNVNTRQSARGEQGYIDGGNTSWDRVANTENNQSIRTSDFTKQQLSSKHYKLKPGEECQYAVEYDQQTRFLLEKSKKKKVIRETEYIPFGAVQSNNVKDSKIGLKTRHQELVSILFQGELYEAITNVDLNEIVSNHCILKIPLPKPQQPSSDEDNQSVIGGINASEPKSKKSIINKKMQDQENMIQSLDQKYLVYGVTMFKMRKILTIRTPFTLYNKTLFDYQVRFTERSTGFVKEVIILKADKKHPINFKYYTNCDISIKIVQANSQEESESESMEMIQKHGKQKEPKEDGDEYYSQKCFIDSLMVMPVDNGSMVQHNNGKHTYIKKQVCELKDAYDLTLLPPIVVKNALPCEISVLGNQYFQEGKQLHSEYEGQAYEFQKGEEKYFHIFTYNGESKDEILLKFRVSGYAWSQVSLKQSSKKDRKSKKFSEKTREMDIECRDVDGSSVYIGVRVQTINAYFHVTFFAHTCIINHSLFKMKFHYDQINKPLLGGQEQNNRDFILANKDQALIASLFDKSISKSIKIKTAGIKDEFSIVSGGLSKGQYENINNRKNSKDPDSENADGQNNGHSYQRYKKYEFVFTTYLSLAIEDDFIYTKIVQISPKYVIVNKMRTQICISQEGCQDYSTETLNPKERREWVWPNAGQPELMIVKRPNFNPEMMYYEDNVNTSLAQVSESGKKKSWNWSSSFKISDLGLMTLQIRRKGTRINSENTRKIIRITTKLVDATIFVILEDEDKENPYYKIENACESLVIDCVQKGADMRAEGCELLPRSEMPFAFSDSKNEHVLVCDIGNLRNSVISNKREHQQRLLDDIIIQKEYNLERMGQKDKLVYTSTLTGQQKNLYINVYTNGCTKILRFSDKSLEQEALDLKSKQFREQGMLNTGLDVKTTIEVSLKELGFSIVSPVATKKKKSIVTKRKEIAYITIGNLGFNQHTSKNYQQTSITVGVFQIDNQSNANALFPTIFQQKILKSQDHGGQFMNVNMVLKVEKPLVTYVDEMEVNISGMIIKLDDEFLGYALNFAFDLLEMMKTNFTGIHPIFMPPEIEEEGQQDMEKQFGYGNDRMTYFANKEKFIGKKNHNMQRKQTTKFSGNQFGVATPPNKQKSIKNAKKGKSMKTGVNKLQIEEEIKEDLLKIEEQEIIDNNKEESKFQSWLNKKLDDSSNKLYINNCKLSGLDLEVSFLARKKFQLGEKEDTYQLRKYMNSSGLALINVDEAPIALMAIPLHQVFGDSSNVTAIIMDHYTQGIKNNLFKLVGSTSLLGNPSKFARIMGQGFKDLVNEPRQGQVFYGLAKGSGSLVKNTVEGTFGFMQSISEGFSKGLLLLSMDKDYLCKREEKLITEKPKNFVEGVGYGCQTTINSVLSGFSGVVVRPYKECKKDGIRGLPFGVYSGASGLFLKPLSGGLDLFAKTSEGIKNTAKIFESKVFKDRQRLPRVFYGNQQQIKFYSDSDSYIVMRILYTIKERIFRKDHYIETVKFEEQDRTLFLIITEEHLILLEAAQKSVWWHIQSDFIQQVEKYQNGLIFKLKQKFEGKRHVAIEINNPANIERVYEKVKIYAEAGALGSNEFG